MELRSEPLKARAGGSGLHEPGGDPWEKLKRDGIEILGGMRQPGWGEVLEPAALAFVAKMTRQFSSRREELLGRREAVQAEIDGGKMPDFLPETEEIRRASWKIAPAPQDLQDRRVEITGPMDRKMVVNALNSGANVYMTDAEDAHSPTWPATVQGLSNVNAAVRRKIDFVSDEGREYKVAEKCATLLFRPRGWHLLEKHMRVDGRPVPASLFDFSLYFYHNAKALMERATAPYFYLPKLENHLEARLWNDVFVMAQQELGIPQGTIKATVLIETILAAFEMDEILYELREHSAGLNCGRWDYIFSFIKKFRKRSDFVLPDRAAVTMTTHFLKSYVDLLVRTCHRRGAHAMGGMAAQIPIRDNAAANEAAMEKVRADKRREVAAGHDGTWVAHPGLVPVAKDIFDRGMPGPNQIHVLRDDVRVTAQDLLTVPAGAITETGLRTNISVGIQYLEAWLRGTGCVPLYHLMEDAATAEISRAQVWQWIRHGAKLENGGQVTSARVRKMIREVLAELRAAVGQARFEAGRYRLASEIFEEMMTSEQFTEFLTIPAYEHLE